MKKPAIDMSDCEFPKGSKEYKREYERRYRNSEKGKNALRKYQKNEKAYATQLRYRNSEKGKETARKYQKKGKEKLRKSSPSASNISNPRACKSTCVKCGCRAIKEADLLSPSYGNYNGKWFIINDKKTKKIKKSTFVCSECL